MASEESPKLTWGRPIEFLLLSIGNAVGFANVWRFPYICYRNGGGVFLVPYLLAVFLLGIPASFLEGALGQFTSCGEISALRIVPLFQGVGVMVVVMLFIIMCFYSVLFAWVLFYLFASFSAKLPWSHCNNEWNSGSCRAISDGLNQTRFLNRNGSGNSTSQTEFRNVTDPATEFWERRVLSLSSGIDHIGPVKWDLALCLLLAWVIIYFCVWRGTKWVGKISYVTCTVPYLLLVALLVRGVTLDGAGDGIKLYLMPDWSRLRSAQVWLDACSQVFFSYAVGMSVHTALGSRNEFHHNILKHYFFIALANSGTSFLCGFVVFSVLGFMANEQGVSVHEVVESGPGLAFIVYPQAIAQMPIPHLWAVLFFLTLSFIGVDSEFTGAESVVLTISDLLPLRYSQSPRRELFAAALCAIWFLNGLPLVTEGGVYLQQVYEWYCTGKWMFIIVLCECVVISYFYGSNRFHRNLEFMLGYRIGPFFKYLWMVVTPAICLALLFADLLLSPGLVYKRRSGVYHFPNWTSGLGWSLVLCLVVWIPGVIVWRMARSKGTLTQRFRRLLKPDFTEIQQRRDRGVLNREVDQQDSIALKS